jgi:hypothetical protein
MGRATKFARIEGHSRERAAIKEQGKDCRRDFVGVVNTRRPHARRKNSRLFTVSLTITRKWDYLRAAWEDDRPWPPPRAPIADVVP